MRHHVSFIIAFYALTFACAAQFAPCNSDKPSTVEHRDGVTELKLNFAEPTGEVPAYVFVPDAEAPVPGIVFSHSAIRGANARVDLLRFARGLALAGAASIVLDGTIEWETPNDDSKRPYHLTACAGHWLLENLNVDQQRLAHAGPGAWAGSGGYYCVEGEPLPCYHSPWLNFGRTSNAEFRNTERMLTPEGRLQMAQWTQRVLDLKEINPEWFEPGLSRSKH